MTASVLQIGQAGRFTKNPYASKRHLDLLKQKRLIAHHDMMETITSEFHNRKKNNWRATTQKLIQTLVKDTGRKKAPGLRRTQLVLNDLERWGLIRRYCPSAGKPIAQRNDKARRMALSNDRGLHIKIAGLDCDVPDVERFEEQLQNRKSPTAGDRRACPVPPDPIKIEGVRSLGDRSKLDGSLNGPSPYPPSQSKNHACDCVPSESSDETRPPSLPRHRPRRGKQEFTNFSKR